MPPEARGQRPEVGSQTAKLRSPTAELPLLAIAGPTAVGKSEVAIRLAERFNGEIISVDSMQVYRGLDIGTAKPSPADRTRVPHHLIDVVDLNEPFDAAKFSDLARLAEAAIRSRHRMPTLCGGTGLYFKALLDGLGDAPPSNPGLRAELEATPLAALLRELAERDPRSYERIDRCNPRRVVRAVEVIRLTGRPFSEQRARWGETPGEPSGDAAVLGSRGRSPRQSDGDASPSADHESRITHPASAFIGLMRSPSDLHQRIDARVDEMFRRGLVAETEQLLKQGLAQNKTAMQALGYRQVIEHLQGKCSLAETRELIKLRTRQFAKRQMTWFSRQMPLNWVRIEATDSAKTIAERIATALNASDWVGPD